MARNSKFPQGVGYAFSKQTLLHAMLYIPEGEWAEAVYDGEWYQFNNIREITMKNEDISNARAYMLMDTKSFGYAIYDDRNDDVKMAKAFYSFDEHESNNNWLVKVEADNKYLYNLGAKKYAKIAADGRLELTQDATPLSMTKSENGIIIGTDKNHEWAFVKNNSLNVPTLIETPVNTINEASCGYYSLDGQQIVQPKKGLNIIKMNDGKTRKVIFD